MPQSEVFWSIENDFTIYTFGICFRSMYQMSGRGIQFIKNRDF